MTSLNHSPHKTIQRMVVYKPDRLHLDRYDGAANKAKCLATEGLYAYSLMEIPNRPLAQDARQIERLYNARLLAQHWLERAQRRRQSGVE